MPDKVQILNVLSGEEQKRTYIVLSVNLLLE